MAITKLNQKDRIVEFPNRYKLNLVAGQTDTYDLESVTGEIVESGTAFNKNYGDIIDANFIEVKNINRYNKITGALISGQARYEFDDAEVDISGIGDENVVYVKATNGIQGPATDFQIIKDKESMTFYGYNNDCMAFDNDNILCVGRNGSYTGIITIDSNGNAITTPATYGTTYIPNNSNLFKMSNGNILIMGGNSNSCYYEVFNQNGQYLNGGRVTGYEYTYKPYATELSNGNVVMFTSGSASDTVYGYYSITTSTGQQVVSSSYLESSYEFNHPQAIVLDNNNVMVFGTGRNTYGTISYKIYNSDFTSVVQNRVEISSSFAGAENGMRILKLNNGNIFVVRASKSSSTLSKYFIINQSGTLVKAITSLTGVYSEDINDIFLLPNGNVYIGFGKGQYIVLNNAGTIVHSFTSQTQNMQNAKHLLMSSGNVVIIGDTGGVTADTYYAIVDGANYNIVKNSTYINSLNQQKGVVESGGNIVIVFATSTTADALSILKPISSGSGFVTTLDGKQVDGQFEKGKYYELVYNQSTNKFSLFENRKNPPASKIQKIDTGTLSAKTTIQTMSLGYKPDLVLIYNANNNTNNTSSSTSNATYSYVPRVITQAYSYNGHSITDTGFQYTASTTTTLYYMAIKFNVEG